jgi:hypothetical protein
MLQSSYLGSALGGKCHTTHPVERAADKHSHSNLCASAQMRKPEQQDTDCSFFGLASDFFLVHASYTVFCSSHSVDHLDEVLIRLHQSLCSDKADVGFERVPFIGLAFRVVLVIWAEAACSWSYHIPFARFCTVCCWWANAVYFSVRCQMCWAQFPGSERVPRQRLVTHTELHHSGSNASRSAFQSCLLRHGSVVMIW